MNPYAPLVSERGLGQYVPPAASCVSNVATAGLRASDTLMVSMVGFLNSTSQSTLLGALVNPEK